MIGDTKEGMYYPPSTTEVEGLDTMLQPALQKEASKEFIADEDESSAKVLTDDIEIKEQPGTERTHFKMPPKIAVDRMDCILAEIQERQQDFLTIICKDNIKFRASGLLLVAVSPSMAHLLKNVELEDCVISMPDVSIDSIKDIFDQVYSSMDPRGSAKVENIDQSNKRKLDNTDNSASNEASSHNLASNEASSHNLAANEASSYNLAFNESSSYNSVTNEASSYNSVTNEASSYNSVTNEASNSNSEARTRHDSDEPIDYQMKKKNAALAHAGAETVNNDDLFGDDVSNEAPTKADRVKINGSSIEEAYAIWRKDPFRSFLDLKKGMKMKSYDFDEEIDRKPRVKKYRPPVGKSGKDEPVKIEPLTINTIPSSDLVKCEVDDSDQEDNTDNNNTAKVTEEVPEEEIEEDNGDIGEGFDNDGNMDEDFFLKELSKLADNGYDWESELKEEFPELTGEGGEGQGKGMMIINPLKRRRGKVEGRGLENPLNPRDFKICIRKPTVVDVGNTF